MKNLTKMKSILAGTMCIAGTLVFMSSCSDNEAMDTKDVAEQENVDKLSSDNQTVVVIDNDNATKFFMRAAEMQLEEIKLGKLAQQRGTTAEVKDLGKMMETEHSKSLAEIQTLAQSKSVSIPTSPTNDSKDAYEKLGKESGKDFDKAYSKLMVEHHEDAIELFEKASTDSDDPEIRAWATAKLPGLRTHLEHAKSCKEKGDKVKS